MWYLSSFLRGFINQTKNFKQISLISAKILAIMEINNFVLFCFSFNFNSKHMLGDFKPKNDVLKIIKIAAFQIMYSFTRKFLDTETCLINKVF